jgi:hypothetical protein
MLLVMVRSNRKWKVMYAMLKMMMALCIKMMGRTAAAAAPRQLMLLLSLHQKQHQQRLHQAKQS